MHASRFALCVWIMAQVCHADSPDVVKEFHARALGPTIALLEWKPPRKPGVFRYKIAYQGHQKSIDEAGIEQTTIDPLKDIMVPKEEFSVTIDGLMQNAVYTFNISVNFIDGTWGPSKSLLCETSPHGASVITEAPKDQSVALDFAAEVPVITDSSEDQSVTLDFATEAPVITEAPKDQSVAHHGIISFICKASGSPTPDIYWRTPAGQNLTNYRYTVLSIPGGSVLRIEPVEYSRTLACVASNGIGEPAVATVELNVYEIPEGYPRITEHPTLKAVEKDRTAIMSCSATGTPEPTVTWFHNSIPVDLSDPRLTFTTTGSLIIRKAEETDEGKYECVAENSVGVTYSYGANLYVRVRRVPPHFSQVPESVEVMPGADVNLTCIAVGSPSPSVKWMIGSDDLTPEDEIPIVKNILVLTDIQRTATYTCVAYSSLGSIESDAEVRVREAIKHSAKNILTSILIQ